MENFGIILPKISNTGGPESLHNLARCIKRLGYEVVIYTKNIRNKLDYFSDYNVEYKNLEDARTARNTTFILPETSLFYLNQLYDNKKTILIWWLSTRNFTNSLKIRYVLRNYGPKALFCVKPNITLRKILHLYQTEFARGFLSEKGVASSTLLKLESPLNDRFYSEKDSFKTTKVKKSIAINPAKLSHREKKDIIRYFTQNAYNVQCIENMKREEVVGLLKNTEFLLDIGPHPGQERLPREAILMDCYPLVGMKGTASSFDDFPLPLALKLDTDARLDRILKKAHHLMEECKYNHMDSYEHYKDYCKKQPERFIIQLKTVLSRIKSEFI